MFFLLTPTVFSSSWQMQVLNIFSIDSHCLHWTNHKNAGSEFFCSHSSSSASFYYSFPILKQRYNRNESNTFRFLKIGRMACRIERRISLTPPPTITLVGYPGTGQFLNSEVTPVIHPWSHDTLFRPTPAISRYARLDRSRPALSAPRHDPTSRGCDLWPWSLKAEPVQHPVRAVR